jgi:cation:H+ antiporter
MMNILVDSIILLGSFYVLIKGAHWLVEGSASLAQRLGISQLVIGLTVVAFGTSLPELIVNIFASLNGQNGVTFGNVIGSNIVNILLILGITSILATIFVQKTTIRMEIPFSIIAVIALIATTIDGTFSRADAGLLLLFFLSFLWYIKKLVQTHSIQPDTHEHTLTKSRAVVYIVGGLAGLILGGKYVVSSAVSIAQFMGFSQFIIGATIVAIGTSLPELVTSVVAALQQKSDIAVGNIVGSNIFNIFFIMGVSGLLSPAKTPAGSLVDMFFLLGVSGLLLFCCSHKKLTRSHGIFFVSLYVVYVLFLLIR